jgi:putative DNA primase/helicase
MLRNRYLIDAQQRYYFRDRQQVMAFEDLGARLRTSHDDPEVAASMVVLAQAKGWSHLKLRGSAAFKREAWLAAAERGLQVSGHRPSALDKARLAERLTERETQRQRNANEIAPATRVPDAAPPKTVPRKRRKNTDGKQKAAAPQLTPPQREAVSELEKFLRQRGDSEEAVAMTLQIATDKLAHHRTHFGELIEHGDAPYQHDRENDMSYFATLQTRNGKQIIWGIDLQRALAESGAAIGDDIVLVQQGRRPVEVSAPERDASGRKTGKRVALDADRNNWDVVSLDNARDFASERSQPPKSMQTTRGRSNNTLPPEHTAGLEQARQHVR